MKKVLFIIPPFFDDEKSLYTRAPIFAMPTGILSIEAYIREYAQCQILDLNRWLYDNPKNDIYELLTYFLSLFNPDIMAISVLFDVQYDWIKKLSEFVSVHYSPLIVVGGGVATNMYKEIIMLPKIDAVCYGEGELSMLELTSVGTTTFSSWVTKEKIKNSNWKPQYNFVNNLDSIMPLNYNLLDMTKYPGRQGNKVDSDGKQLAIFTSRGCPFNCVFCSSSSVHGKTIRIMSIGRIIEDVTTMVTKYNISILAIEDDHFLIDKERAKAILTMLAPLKLRIEFPNGLAIYNIDDEVAQALAVAGTTTVSLALESGSQYILDVIINKPLKLDMVKTAVAALRKYGIRIHACLVMGLPGETKKHRRETRQFLLDTGFDLCYFNLAVPVRGSRLYDQCEKDGTVITGMHKHNTAKCNIKLIDCTPEELEDEVYKLNLDVNFAHNYNIEIGNYPIALSYMKAILINYPNHAFAHYCLSHIYCRIGEDISSHYHYSCFCDAISTDKKWRKYAEYFGFTE